MDRGAVHAGSALELANFHAVFLAPPAPVWLQITLHNEYNLH
jgi:hypothetical protein